MRRKAGPPCAPSHVPPATAFPCAVFPCCFSHETLWAKRNFPPLLASFPSLQPDATPSSRKPWGRGCCHGKENCALGCKSLNARKWWWTSATEQQSPCPACTVLPDQGSPPSCLAAGWRPHFSSSPGKSPATRVRPAAGAASGMRLSVFMKNPHLAPGKTPPLCGTHTFQPCFFVLALEGPALAVGQE